MSDKEITDVVDTSTIPHNTKPEPKVEFKEANNNTKRHNWKIVCCR